MHDIADDLYKDYQQGKVESSKEGLKDLSMIFEQINSLFDQ
mgnify:FL=1